MKNPFSRLRGIATTAMALLLLANASAHATSYNWTNAASGNWNTAANWNPNGVPGANDSAAITNLGVTVNLNSGTTVAGLNVGGFFVGTTTLSLNGQTLALNGPMSVYPSGSFTVDWGTLVGNTNAVLNGTYTWSATSSGSLAGTLTLAPGGILNIITGNNHDMPGCIFTNNGTVVWNAGNIRGGNGGTIYNYGLWDAQSDQYFCLCGYGGSEVFNNFGTFRKSGGASEFANATIFQNVTFNQLAGMIDVQNGTNGLELAFQNGGSFTGGYITTNQFGLTVLSVGNFNLNGTVTGTNTWENSGNLVGANVIQGALTWVNGNWNSAPSVTISPNSTLIVTTGNNHDLAGCAFTNNGTLVWNNGTIRGGNGGTIYNYGLWDAQSDQYFCLCGYGGSEVFNNYGSFRKSGGASEFANATIFQNVTFNQLAGVIDVQNGTNGLELAFQNGGNFTGGYITTNQFGLTVLSVGSFNLNGTVTGTNTWENGGSLAGTSFINGALTWQSGSWNNAASVTITANSKLLVAGGADHDMQNTVVTNYGTVAWGGGRIRGGGGLNPGTAIYNYGLWDSQWDLTFNNDYGGNGTIFNNFGTLRKSGGAGIGSTYTLFAGGVFFNQLAGMIDVQNSTNGLELVFQGSGNFTGGYFTTNVNGISVLSSGNFNLNGTVTTTNVFENAGNLVGTNVINGALTWQSGNWNSAASVTVLVNSTLLIAGGSDHDLANTVINNYGAVAWSGGRIRGGGGTGTRIYNYGLWDSQWDLTLTDDYGANGTVFNNYGTFRKSGGAGIGSTYTLLASGVFFNQLAGMIDVQNGTSGLELAFQGGGNFTGGFVTTNSHSLTVLSVGNFNLNGTITSSNVIQNAGNLVGTNVIRGALTWQNGYWYGANSVTISSNSTVVMAGGGNNMLLYNLPVTNYGTFVWSSGYPDGGSSPGTQIYNYGLWDCQSDYTFKDDGGASGTMFYNYGTFRKSAGTNTSQTVLNNGVNFNLVSGVLDVQQGTLLLQGGGNFTGGYVTTNRTAFTYLNFGNFNLNGTLTPLNVIQNAGNLVGNNVVKGALTWQNGYWYGANSVTISSNSTVVMAGGGNNMLLYNLVVTNYGTFVWSSGYPDGGSNPGTQIYNYGLWDCQGDYTFKNDAGASGSTFYNYGTFRKSVGNPAGGTVFNGGVTMVNSSTIETLVGNLNFNTTPTFNAGLLRFGIGGTNTFGVINLAGTVNLAGGAGAVLLNGFVPATNSTYAVMNYGGFTGSFTDYSGLNAGSGVAFTPTLSATKLTLSTISTNFTAVPPTIISQPQGQTVNYGDTVTLGVGVSGSPTLLYQWNRNNVPLAGATNSTLTLSNVTLAPGGTYTVTVTNSAGGVLSQGALLTVNPVLPAFTSQPQSVTVPAGSNVTFSVTVIGGPAPILQWQFNGTNLVDGGRISGSASTNLSIINLHFSDAGNYTAIASNAYGMATSYTAVLHVGFPDLAPYAVTPPTNATLGQTLQLVYSITNSASGRADGPWLNQFLLAVDTNGTSAYNMGTATFNGSILPFSSVTVTQAVIMPATIFGPRYFGVVVDSSASLPEISLTNNTAYATNATQINGADLALERVTAPGTAQYGQNFTVNFAVTNIGTAPAIAGWSDQIYLSSSPTSLSGATLLASLPGTFPLAPGAGYAVSQSVTIPQTSSSSTGTFYLIADTDAGDTQIETNYANNLLSTPLVLSLPPLPDLVAGQVVSPTNALAGQSIAVSWAVTNIGNATANAPWQETVYLIPASLTLSQFNTNSSAYPAIGVFTFTNSLAAGSSLTRTQQVVIPLTGLSGDLRAAVLVDSGNTVLEQNPTNNAALALNDLQVPAALTLSLPVTSVTKNTSTPNLSCLVSRNGDASLAAAVSLTSSATNLFLVPASVTIPAGAASAPFSATIIDDGVPGPDTLVTIGASAGGYLSSTSQVTVVNTDVPILTLSLSASQVTEGQKLTATVTSSNIRTNPVTVTIGTSSSSALSAPTSVSLPAYSNSVSFTVLTVQKTFIDPAQIYAISVSASGYQGASANLTVLNNNAPTLSLMLSSTNIEETAGPFAAIGSVSRLPITDQAVTISLTSTNPGAATVPAQVTIPSFQNSISFYVAAVNDTNITGTKTALISAQTLDSGGNAVGSAATQLLFVQDESGPNLKVTIANQVVGKSLNPATTGVVSLAAAPTNNVLVSLTSSATNEATIPPTVTVLAGQTNATFNITSLNDGMSGTSQQVTITATASGYAQGSAGLTVTDLGLPDLVVASITVPATAYAPAPLTIGFRLLNQGLGALTNGVNQNVYLTTDPTSANYFPVGTTYFPGPLAAGQYVDESLVVPGTGLAAPGTYWVVVIADAYNTAAELNEINNTSVSQTPVVIAPAYFATVMAGTNNVLPGTPVPLSGSATLVAGGPATNSPVNILVTVRGLQRILSVTTDTNGNFSTVFNPLPNEAGNYTIAAVFPGITSAPAQDQFNILGMLASPTSLSLAIIQSSNQTASINLQNLGEVTLTGLSATINGLAANLSASTSFTTNYLAGQNAVGLTLQITATDASVLQSSFTVQVTSSEGAVLNVPVNVTVNALTANLVAYPSSLSASMLRGSQTIVTFSLVNSGGAPSGPLSINLPSVSWLSVASTNPIPSIAPGATNQVTLLLSPDANMALGPYTGSLSVIGTGVGLLMPFNFTAVSDAHGALTVSSVDEYTYFAAGSPPLTNASVTLINPYTGAVVASGVTDRNGQYFVSGVMEGVYELDLSANQHAPFRGEAVISAGQTNSMLAFLARQTVTFTWTVIPTSIQDTTHITIDATFETDVPAPVVVPNPASIDLGPLTQPGQYLDIPFTVENYGLIGVHNLNINISQSPLYRFDLATTTLGDLPAHGTYTIPMRITRLASPSAPKSPQATPGALPCSITFNMDYTYPCGPVGVHTTIPVTILNVFGDCAPGVSYSSYSVSCVNCGGGDSGYGLTRVSSGPGGNSGVSHIPFQISFPPSCDPCYDAARDCLIGLIGLLPPAAVVSCGWSLYTGCGGSMAENGVFSYATAENCASAAVGCWGGKIGAAASCLQSLFRCICPIGKCWTNIVSHVAPSGAEFLTPGASAGTGLNNSDLRDVYLARTYVQVAFLDYIFGDPDERWLSQGSGGSLGSWMAGFTNAIAPGSPMGLFISPDEATNLLAQPVPNTVSNADMVAAINRWNLSISNWTAGVFSPTNVAAGGNTNFMDLYAFTNYMILVGNQYKVSQAAGYDSPLDGLVAAMQASGKQAGSVCARVVLQIDQDAVLTRDAFHATLQLNNSSTDPLSNISVNLAVQNTSGQDVTSLLGIEAPVMSGNLTAVDGTGSLQPNGSGSAQWTIIPSIDAAPQAPTNYLVSGTFSYVQNGATVTIPLAPAPITVQPNPILYLKYFLQRDVFADDPFTPSIEPSVPFPLAVMVQNQGYGIAHNFQITSAQPKIVDNEKGLLINFKIIGTQVAGQPETPSLTANFGDMAPQSTKIGEWLFISSLQGLFIDYKATFEHIDPLGNPRLSLIQGVEIHQMIHMVQAPGAWDDGQPDFLTVETPNYLSLPDTLYLSDGTIQPVSVVQTGATDAPASINHLQVQFTASFPAGFTYVVVPDPANGQLPLIGVQNSNGTNLLTPNFYTTDRTFIGLGQRPLDENNLHLFDYHTNAGTYTYTLVYAAPTAIPQTNAPVSSMFALPAQSPPTFGLAWSGAPYVGQAPLAFYDIYVSDNGGPYTVWQNHTTATGGFYSGTNGHAYAFYSISTDTVGNREATPLQPQAQTAVVVSNYIPVLTVASNASVNAGQSLSLQANASDPNPFATLTFSLGGSVPQGMTINPATGLITWPTSPAFGGTTNHIAVIVSDNSQPPLSATNAVTIAVIQVINPPVLAPIPNFTVNEGTLLSFTATATESNLPPRTLAFSLGTGAPANAAINSASGLFQWRPAAAQAPSTNFISVIVTDSGVPPLSATQQFKVVVRPVNVEFLLALGTTNVLVGYTSSVPVTLQSGLPLSNITAILQIPSAKLTNFNLQAVSPEIVSSFLQPLGTNLYSINLTLNPSLSAGTSRTLAQLGFLAVQQPHSEIASLNLPQLQGVNADGSAAAKPGTAGGVVYVIGAEPLLAIGPGAKSRVKLSLFGNPGSSYEVDYSTNLLGGRWLLDWRVPMTNPVVTFDANQSAPQLFYRAASFSANPPILELKSLSPTNLVLLVYGQPGTNYLVLTGTNLTTTNWSALAGFTLTNSFQFINVGGATNPMQFFRAKKP